MASFISFATEGGGFDGVGVRRFHSDGSLDTSYGLSGIALVHELNIEVSIAIQAGQGVLLGIAEPSPSKLVRLDASGTIDTSFGTNGEASLGSSESVHLAIQGDGKIFAAQAGNLSTLSRFHSNGQPDTEFGAGGSLLITTPDGFDVTGQRVLVTHEGKIIVGG